MYTMCKIIASYWLVERFILKQIYLQMLLFKHIKEYKLRKFTGSYGVFIIYESRLKLLSLPS